MGNKHIYQNNNKCNNNEKQNSGNNRGNKLCYTWIRSFKGKHLFHRFLLVLDFILFIGCIVLIIIPPFRIMRLAAICAITGIIVGQFSSNCGITATDALFTLVASFILIPVGIYLEFFLFSKISYCSYFGTYCLHALFSRMY